MFKSSQRRTFEAFVGAAMLSALSGCSGVLGIESERTLSDSSKVSLPDEWSCLDDPAPVASTAPMLTQKLHLYDVTASNMAKPIANLSARACPRIDFECATPMSDVATSDAGGIVSLSVPNGFNGYYEVYGLSTYQPYIVAANIVHADTSADVPVAPLAVSAAYAAAGGTKLDPTMGTLLMTVRNCDNGTAGGVSFDVNSSGVSAGADLVYLVNSLPTAGAKETDTASGAAVIFNLAPGAVNAEAKVSEGSFTIGSRAALMRAGWETQMAFYPDQLVVSP